MNPLIQLKTITLSLLITLTLLCIGLLPRAQAVVPPPDGGYPGFNTAEGTKGLFSLTTGSANTAVGWYSLFSNAEGSFNTATGAGALLFNTADRNTATGAAALLSNTIGSGNTANGVLALLNNTEGNGNTANGHGALYFNTTGLQNTAHGLNALYSNTTGGFNTANGVNALFFSTIGSHNIALGSSAGNFVTTADNVICIGLPGADVSNSCYIGQIFGATSPDGIAVFVNSDGKLGTTTSSRRFKNEIQPMDKASEAILALKPVKFHYKSDNTARPQFGLIAEEVAAVNPDLVVRDKEGKPYSVRYEAVNAMLLNEFLKEHSKVQEQGATIAQQRKDFEVAIAQQHKEIEALTAGLQKVSAQLEASKPAPQLVVHDQ
jgi:Chaperone of endosialidase